MSELHVATIGRVGCGAVSHVRSSEGGVRSDSRDSWDCFAAILDVEVFSFGSVINILSVAETLEGRGDTRLRPLQDVGGM